MIGPQNGVVKAQLGSLLNGLINYEYWLPVEGLVTAAADALLERYQARAQAEGADPLGYYVAPLAYAQMQVVAQAISAVGSLDDAALSAYAHSATFDTLVGDVTFGDDGAWTHSHVLTVQFHGIESNEIAQFRSTATEAVVHPGGPSASQLIYPYAAAKRAPQPSATS
jgi:branched-chain amino acid transport system substrate-binding protein